MSNVLFVIIGKCQGEKEKENCVTRRLKKDDDEDKAFIIAVEEGYNKSYCSTFYGAKLSPLGRHMCVYNKVIVSEML